MTTNELITLKVNDADVTVERGTPLIEAIKTVGGEVPHFCYHKHIGIEGSCRMCLVEIKNAPKLMISCATRAAEGMEIYTDTDRVKTARKAVLEFLLINHPLDCPICDKGGECPLQNYSFEYGAGGSRYDIPKELSIKHTVLGDHIIFDAERCVLCTRCSRFQRDVVGYQELGVIHRGHTSIISMVEGKTLQNTFSGNLADICPVGALTLRDFRFKARPWEMKQTVSTCTSCSLGCKTRIWSIRDTILRTTPEEDLDVNLAWLCDKGRFAFQRHTELDTPYVRNSDGRYQKIELEASARIVREKLTALSRMTDVEVVLSAELTDEEIHQLHATFDGARFTAPIPSAVWQLRDTLTAQDPIAIHNVKGKIVVLGSLESHPVLHIILRKRHVQGGADVIVYADYPYLAKYSPFRIQGLNAESHAALLQDISDAALVLFDPALCDDTIVEALQTPPNGDTVHPRQTVPLWLGFNWFNLLRSEPLAPTGTVTGAKLRVVISGHIQPLSLPAVDGCYTVTLSNTMENATADMLIPLPLPEKRGGSFANLFGTPRKLSPYDTTFPLLTWLSRIEASVNLKEKIA